MGLVEGVGGLFYPQDPLIVVRYPFGFTPDTPACSSDASRPGASILHGIAMRMDGSRSSVCVGQTEQLTSVSRQDLIHAARGQRRNRERWIGQTVGWTAGTFDWQVRQHYFRNRDNFTSTYDARVFCLPLLERWPEGALAAGPKQCADCVGHRLAPFA